MPNYINSSSRAKKTKRGNNEKLENGNPETQQSSDNVASKVLFKTGNISDLTKVFMLGEKGSGTRPLGSLQNYDALRKKCLDKGSLFEDPEFPAQLSSIYGSKKVEKAVKWVRPPGIVPNPQFFVEGVSRFDIKQGGFGNCWFLAATANLAMHEDLFAKVVPEDQNFSDGRYAGIFHFRFWQYGRWIDVVIDDRLPMFKGELLGLHSASKNEFWTALLEKAYAKLHGSYVALESGDSGDAMEDFTGGVAELYGEDSLPSDLFDVLLKAYEKNSLMGCSFKKAEKHDKKEHADDEGGNTEEEKDDEENGEEGNDDEENGEEENDAEEGGEEAGDEGNTVEETDNEPEENNDDEDADADEGGDEVDEEENQVSESGGENEDSGSEEEKDPLEGLIELHAYSITEVKYVSKGTDSDEKIPLVRVRNPWGTAAEWLGAWSDKSPEWESIPEETKNELGFKSADDGEFWICFQDLKDHLSDLEICYLNLHSVLDNPEEKEWEISAFEGEWVSGVTAGGCFNDMKTFPYNPQYHLTLDEECTVIIALMQKNRRTQGNKSVNFLHIGFLVVPLKDDPSVKIPKPLHYEFFDEGDLDPIDVNACKKESAPDSSQFSAHRQVSCRVKLQSGSYCIIPCTYNANEDGEFLLRVFSEKPHKLEEYHEQVGIDEVDNDETNESLTNERFREYFRMLSGDDWELDWVEHKKVMDFMMSTDLPTEGLSKSACRSMVALLDVDRSGKLSFTEFKAFHADISKLIIAFKEVAVLTNEDDGYLSTFNLRKALNEAGYHVDIHMLGRLVRRYGTEDHKITLEDFIMCALRIKYLLGIFKARDPSNSNTAAFTLGEWFDNTLYL